eukprot:6163648-Amphidinium_carterae.2
MTRQHWDARQVKRLWQANDNHGMCHIKADGTEVVAVVTTMRLRGVVYVRTEETTGRLYNGKVGWERGLSSTRQGRPSRKRQPNTAHGEKVDDITRRDFSTQHAGIRQAKVTTCWEQAQGVIRPGCHEVKRCGWHGDVGWPDAAAFWDGGAVEGVVKGVEFMYAKFVGVKWHRRHVVEDVERAKAALPQMLQDFVTSPELRRMPHSVLL